MKGNKCLYWLLSIVLVFSACLSISSPVIALELGSGFDFKIKDPSGSASGTALSFTHSDNDWYADFAGSSLNNLAFDIVPYDSADTIPDRYLITFNVSYTSNIGANVTVSGHYRYDGLQSTNMQLLNESCVDRTNGPIYNGSVLSSIGQGIISCTYLFYSAAAYDDFTSYPDSRIWYGESSSQNRVMITPGFIRAISWNGLTEDDREWLESVLGSSTDVSAVVNSINNLRTDTQEQTEAIEEQTEVISDMNDFLQDDSEPEVDSSALADSAGWLPAGPVDSILTLPLTFIQALLNVFQTDNCQPVVLPLPYLNGETLTLPCMRPILNQMGFLSIYEVVGSVISMFVIWDTLKWLYKWVDDTLQFRENNQFGGF